MWPDSATRLIVLVGAARHHRQNDETPAAARAAKPGPANQPSRPLTTLTFIQAQISPIRGENSAGERPAGGRFLGRLQAGLDLLLRAGSDGGNHRCSGVRLKGTIRRMPRWPLTKRAPEKCQSAALFWFCFRPRGSLLGLFKPSRALSRRRRTRSIRQSRPWRWRGTVSPINRAKRR